MQEYYYCLSKNTRNDIIDKIYILKEGSFDIPLIKKISILTINERPTFNKFFDIINKYTDLEDINIVANSDIYFDDSIGLSKEYLSNNNCFALSRWELTEPIELFAKSDSQDVWIFKGNVKEGINGEFFLGIMGCDNKIAFELRRAGYQIENPSFSIRAYHMHFSDQRNYNKLELQGPFLAVVPDSFDSCFTLLKLCMKKDQNGILKLKFRILRIIRPAIRIGIRLSGRLKISSINNYLRELHSI